MTEQELLKLNKWKLASYQNVAFKNMDRFHTFDSLFQHLKDRLTDITVNMYKLNLLDVEIPQADPAWTRTNYTMNQLSNSSKLPRAVLMYNIDASNEPFIDIPSMNRTNRMNWSMSYSFLNIRQHKLGRPDGEYFDYMKDIDMALVGTPKYASATIFWSLLVNERPRAVELLKSLKEDFPLNEQLPFYAGKRITDANKYGRFVPIPYGLETYVPDACIDRIRKTFQLTNDVEGNETLLYILNKWSTNRVEWKANSGTGQSGFAIIYSSPVFVMPTSIDLIDYPDNNTKTFGVKLEFQVNYIEFPISKLSCNLKLINKNNPILIFDKEPKQNTEYAYVQVNEAHFTEEINETTLYEDYIEVQYTEEDIKGDVVYDEEAGESVIKKYAVINIFDLLLDTNIRAYVHYLYHSECINNLNAYFNIEAQANWKFKGHIAEWGTNHNFKINYEKAEIYDDKGEPGRGCYIAIYVNKPHFNQWCIDNGFKPLPNLSAVNYD